MKIVMYHYVRPTNSNYPYFKGLNIVDFKRQLDWFSSNGGFVDRDDFLNVFNGRKKTIPKKEFVLTFDDGLSDHYSFVYPELKKRNIFGIFYIPTLHFSSKKILDVHRIHLLVGRYGGKRMMKELDKIVTKDMMIKSYNDNLHLNTYRLSSNTDKYETEFKRTLNYLISYEYREYVLDKLFDLFMDGYVKYEDIYMSKNEIRELHNSGMIIGSHSKSHKLMSRLSIEEQNNEIQDSFDTIGNIVGGLKIKTFCYPYGGSLSYNFDSINALNNHNVSFTCDVNSKEVTRDDIHIDRHKIPRFDTVDFPYGMSRL